MEVRVAGVFTVSVVVPVTPARVAEIVVEPAAMDVESPPVFIVAILVSAEAQVTRDVRLLVLLSE
jgi:hypothetical protein